MTDSGFEELLQLAQESAAISAMRATPEETASALAQLVDSLYQWANASGTAHRSGTHPLWQPAAGSVAMTDHAEVEDRTVEFCDGASLHSDIWIGTNPARNVTWWSMDAIRRCVMSCVGALSGAATLLPVPGQVRAPIILARAALEALSVIRQLADVDATSDERLRRSLNMRFDEVWSAERGLPSDDRTTTDELVTFAKHLGFDVDYNKRKRGGPDIPRADKKQESAGASIEAMLPGLGSQFWTIQSAVAHSNASNIFVPDEWTALHEVSIQMQARGSSLHLDSVVSSLQKTLPHLSAYTGWPKFPDDEALSTCRTALNSCAGGDDDRIRAVLGFDD
jgi:hypothetical protein